MVRPLESEHTLQQKLGKVLPEHCCRLYEIIATGDLDRLAAVSTQALSFIGHLNDGPPVSKTDHLASSCR